MTGIPDKYVEKALSAMYAAGSNIDPRWTIPMRAALEAIGLPALLERVEAAEIRADTNLNAAAEAEAELAQLRNHKIGDPALHDLHENAKAYSLANTALSEVWDYTHSTTLEWLIRQKLIGPVDALAAKVADAGEWEIALRFQDGEVFTPESLRTGVGLFDDEAPVPVARHSGDDEWIELGSEFVAEYDHLVNPDLRAALTEGEKP